MTPTELQEQTIVVQYLELLKQQGKILAYCGLPNNTWTKSWSQKRKQTQEGVKKGFPDLVVVTKDTVLFLEMKRIKGGVLSPEQKEWLSILPEKKTQSVVAKGFDEAKKIIDNLV